MKKDIQVNSEFKIKCNINLTENITMKMINSVTHNGPANISRGDSCYFHLAIERGNVRR